MPTAIADNDLRQGLRRLIFAGGGDVLTALVEARASRQQIAKAFRAVAAMRRQQPAMIQAHIRELTILFVELGARVAETYEKVGPREAVNVTHDDRILVEHILTASSLREWAGDRLTPNFWMHWERSMDGVVRSLRQLGLIEDVRGDLAREVLTTGGRRAGLVDIIGDTRTALFRALDQAREAGLGPKQTARLIRDFIPEGRFVNAGAAYRAELIARTETLHAQRSSSIASYRSTSNIRHVVAFDGDIDKECSDRNGELYTLDEAEGELSNTHPNCVLSFGPVAD